MYMTFLRPNTSERDPAGSEMIVPGIVEAAMTKPPWRPASAPKLLESMGRIGLLDIVELRIASAPVKLNP